MNRDEIFKQAVEANKVEQQKAAERQNNSNNNNTRQYEDLHYSVLNDSWGIYRVLGLPMDADGQARDSFSPRMVYMSNIIADDGSMFRCYFPSRKVNPDWIMWRILDAVQKIEWQDGEKVSAVQDNHPEVYNIVTKNGKEKTHKGFRYEKGWNPSLYIPFNVIDRSRAEWHKENKHTVILTKKASMGKKKNPNDPDRWFYDIGVTITVYNGMMNIAEAGGDWETYDVAIRKLTNEPWYEVDYPTTDSIKFKNLNIPIIKGNLTEEELAYEKYDFDKLFHPSYYQKIRSKIKGKIAEIDVALGTNFLAELDDLAQKEKDSMPASEEKTTVVEGSDMPAREVTETKETIENPAPRRETKSTTETHLDESTYKGMAILSEEEKNMITGMNADGTLQYNPKAGRLFACPDEKCGFAAPESFGACPKCGIKF